MISRGIGLLTVISSNLQGGGGKFTEFPNFGFNFIQVPGMIFMRFEKLGKKKKTYSEFYGRLRVDFFSKCNHCFECKNVNVPGIQRVKNEKVLGIVAALTISLIRIDVLNLKN